MPTASSLRVQSISIGRAPENDVQLDYPMTSWNHARIMGEGNGWIIEDCGSTNGTGLNSLGNRIKRAALQPTDEIYFGSCKIPASRILSKKHFIQGESGFDRVEFRGDTMVLGRNPSCDYQLNFPMISSRRALLKRAPEGLFVQDLNSRNGPYVDGEPITSRVLVHPGQEISTFWASGLSISANEW